MNKDDLLALRDGDLTGLPHEKALELVGLALKWVEYQDAINHPVFDGKVTLEDSELNLRAREIMAHFYLGMGYMEAPEWEDIGSDFRFGFRSIARYIQEKRFPKEWLIGT